MNKENKDQYMWCVYLLLGLIIGYGIFSFSNNNEEIKACVDSCIQEQDSCVSNYTEFVYPSSAKGLTPEQFLALSEGYVSEDDYQICSNDLEMCVDSC